MSAKYLIRFDDICPQMNWDIWGEIERILDEFDVKPLLAVVPDNRDPILNVASPNESFWERVRQWQMKGWAIGLHGYRHQYESRESGLIGLNPYSEFAGLPQEVQSAKLQAGLAIFHEQRVRAEAWVAPGHSFDLSTVRALHALGLQVISDGYFSRVVRHLNATWIPQQLWRFAPKKKGLWTVCYHHNNWTADDLATLQKDLATYQAQLTCLTEVLASDAPQASIWDRFVAMNWRLKLQVTRQVRSALADHPDALRLMRRVRTFSER